MSKGKIKEMEMKLECLQKKIDIQEKGSVKHVMLMSIKKELIEMNEKAKEEARPKLKVHKDPNDSLCESCQ